MIIQAAITSGGLQKVPRSTDSLSGISKWPIAYQVAILIVLSTYSISCIITVVSSITEKYREQGCLNICVRSLLGWLRLGWRKNTLDHFKPAYNTLKRSKNGTAAAASAGAAAAPPSYMFFVLRKVFFVLRFRGQCFFSCEWCCLSPARCFFYPARCFFSCARCFFSCARCSGILTGIPEPENKGSILGAGIEKKKI